MANRLENLRKELVRLGLDGFIVPRADEHLGEYVPPSAERLSWLTGFTGSAGLAVVLADTAAVFTDGRYVLQLAEQTDAALWQRLHITEQPPPAWIAETAGKDRRIGYDPLLISEEGLARYTEAGLTMVPLEPNPLDAVWTDRPAPPRAAGRTASAGVRRPRLRTTSGPTSPRSCATRGQDAAVLTDPASIAWLLNIRGGDVAVHPLRPGLRPGACRRRDGTVHRSRPNSRRRRAPGWATPSRSPIAQALPRRWIACAGKRVRVDPAGSPVWFAQRLRAAGATVAAAADPCLLPKACKNAVEQDGARAAHRRDAVAVCRFLHWLSVHAPTGQETEISAAEALLASARALDGFRGESFPAISGAGEHGAIIHYRVTERIEPPDQAERGLPDRFRCAVSRRNDRYHPHRLDRSRRRRRRRCAIG